ncbi:hypothetical protein BGX34_003484, partial [Mortierella sp. NVP85]
MGIASFFRRYYGEDDKILSLSPFEMELDQYEPFYQKARRGIEDRRTKQVFAFIDMGGHWGVAVVDLERCEVAFGDCLNQPAPTDRISALVNWIRPRDRDEAHWRWATKQASKFEVPEMERPESSGILAA